CPVPASLHEQFDLVYDSGSLEHIFNFPVAIRNCMEMTRVGGHLILCVPANNNLGHGFYQFSPELFYRVLDASNGFEIERMTALETDIVGPRLLGHRFLGETLGRAFEVTDPIQVHQRVLLVNDRPITLLVRARRVCKVPLFTPTPQQSDYAAQWQEHADQ